MIFTLLYNLEFEGIFHSTVLQYNQFIILMSLECSDNIRFQGEILNYIVVKNILPHMEDLKYVHR